MSEVLQSILSTRENTKGAVAVLVDPDKFNDEHLLYLEKAINRGQVQYVFVGGSILVNGSMKTTIASLKSKVSVPVIIFPGSTAQVEASADAIFLLSLVSGRNPEYLIGKHVEAAPILKKSELEILSTAYIIVGSQNHTAVSYLTNTLPIPSNKPELTMCTALAAEQLGMKVLYLEGGSGAVEVVPVSHIQAVKGQVDLPIVVGGGMKTQEALGQVLEAGADVAVVGTAFEENPTFFE